MTVNHTCHQIQRHPLCWSPGLCGTANYGRPQTTAEKADVSDSEPLSGFRMDLIDDAECRLERYFGLGETSPYTGAAFETYGRNDAHAITSDDVVATLLLSIQVGPLREGMSGWAPQHLLALPEVAGTATELLRQLPADVDLHELDEATARSLLAWDDGDSPGRRLYELLRRGLGVEPGPSRVAVYKLLARKRPRLFAVRDTVVEQAVGHQRPDAWWMPWWHTLQSTEGLVERLGEARAVVPEPARPSLLRVADIAIWMKDR